MRKRQDVGSVMKENEALRAAMSDLRDAAETIISGNMVPSYDGWWDGKDEHMRKLERGVERATLLLAGEESSSEYEVRYFTEWNKERAA